MRLATSDILAIEVVRLLNERNISYYPLNNSKRNELAFTTEGHSKREFEIKFMANGTYRISTRYLGYKAVMSNVCGDVFYKNDPDNTRKLFYVNIPDKNKVNELLTRMLIGGFTTSPSIEYINNTIAKVNGNNRRDSNNIIFTERDEQNRSTLVVNNEKIGRVHFRKNDAWLNPYDYSLINFDEIEKLGLRVEKNPNSKAYPIKIYINSIDETTVANILSQVLYHKESHILKCVEATDVLEEKDTVIDDAMYLSEIDKFDGDDVFLDYIPRRTPKPENIRISDNSKYKRDVTAARFALKRANFKCEFDNSHASFIRASRDEQYMEPHHLIPLSQQELFEYSLDVPANIVSLCSTCHNCIHYGKDNYDLIEKLFGNRKEELEKAGIFVSLDALKRMYTLG